MKKQNCIIIDDEVIAQNILINYIAKLESLELLAVYNNAIEAIENADFNSIDIIFLDIEMPEISGIEFLQMKSHSSNIIISTAYREFALEGFNHDVSDYLLKPFSFDRFLKAVKKATPNPSLQKNKNDFAYFKVDKTMLRIEYNSIRYVEGLSNYIRIITDDKKLITYNKLNDLEKKLPNDQFIRIHKSYIVSVNFIKAYSKQNIFIDSKEIPIGPTYKTTVLKKLDLLNL